MFYYDILSSKRKTFYFNGNGYLKQKIDILSSAGSFLKYIKMLKKQH